MKIIVAERKPLQMKTITEYLRELLPGAVVTGCQDSPAVTAALTEEKADLAVLNIQFPEVQDGTDLALRMRRLSPEIRILFYSGEAGYAVDAFRVHASGFLCQPVTKEDLRRELDYLFPEHAMLWNNKPYLHTFGNFDLFVNGQPVVFKRRKSKEVLAWLTDRKGTWVTNQELMAAIWEDYPFDTPQAKYASLLITGLVTDLERVGAEHIIERRRGRIRLCKEAVECDYFAMLDGDAAVANRFCDEYMSQYSWGEVTLSGLIRISREIHLGPVT